MVEAPGVEVGGATFGLVMARHVSCGEGPDPREKREEAETVSSVLCGFVESRCSSEVMAATEGFEPTGESGHPPAVARSEPPAAVSANESASTRLAALEHLVDAIVVLLDAGDLDRARLLAHAWKEGRP